MRTLSTSTGIRNLVKKRGNSLDLLVLPNKLMIIKNMAVGAVSGELISGPSSLLQGKIQGKSQILPFIPDVRFLYVAE
jgi:hypothetical protein